eukprot:CAMPEP_0206474582 /NCGR_PEP_ID=MMETSP0324_2-20121206/33568_1 /ASSEMBLY_ACC=CAM_ASM_000836 /TAXON_ID=2866 /ORGANISM="Crypthecodinium cohnii, Strain Seligo" /LENGTH=719 /DNA_ID=CAMNT_0053949773 /DNA_START=137 /DNA_END=2293 /DNA_ORIENTATION=+
MLPAFQFSLGHQVLHKDVTIGKYDGQHPCLTAGTAVGKVLIHCPHQRSEDQQEVTFLNINQRISSVAAGLLSPTLRHDVLMIGTPTALMVYDVEENADLFFKEIHDGVSTLAFGNVANIDGPLCVVGGNCSIQGFDHEGNERYWFVTGDNVSALSLCDINGDGKPEEVLCCTEDYEMKIFQHESVLKEITETDICFSVQPLQKHSFAYALQHGTIGVYDKMSRAWRARSKVAVNCFTCFDMDHDGVPEIVSGWENGKIEVRKSDKGAVLSKDHLGTPIASMAHGDYRLDGRSCVMCVTTEGDVRGWLPSQGSAGDAPANPKAALEAKDSEAFRELVAQKNSLQQELNSYQEQMKHFKTPSGSTKDSTQGVIPTDTKLDVTLKSNRTQGTVELQLMTSNYSVIRAVVIFAEHLFDGEACMLHPSPPSNNVIVQISPAKDVQTEMSIKALAGLSSNSVVYHVFEMTYVMPKFAMYHYVEPHGIAAQPEGWCQFVLPKRPTWVWDWIRKSFINIAETMPKPPAGGKPGLVLDANFISLRTGDPLCIQMSEENGGTITIRTNDLEVAGELVQDLATFMSVTELESTADFPEEMEKFKQVLMKVDEYNAVRLKLTAEMADASSLVKALIVKAEDYRLLSDMGNLKKVFGGLQTTNGELIAEYNKRANNHQQLLVQLKEVNLMIQKSSKLRLGNAKTRVVNACRAAIKKNSIHELFQIIRTGHES